MHPCNQRLNNIPTTDPTSGLMSYTLRFILRMSRSIASGSPVTLGGTADVVLVAVMQTCGPGSSTTWVQAWHVRGQGAGGRCSTKADREPCRRRVYSAMSFVRLAGRPPLCKAFSLKDLSSPGWDVWMNHQVCTTMQMVATSASAKSQPPTNNSSKSSAADAGLVAWLSPRKNGITLGTLGKPHHWYPK